MAHFWTHDGCDDPIQVIQEMPHKRNCRRSWTTRTGLCGFTRNLAIRTAKSMNIYIYIYLCHKYVQALSSLPDLILNHIILY